MPENIRVIVEHCLPFMVAAHQGKGAHLNTIRVVEAVIIAAVLGLGAWLVLIPELKTEFSYMKRDLNKVSTQVEVIQKDVNQLKLDVAVDSARHERSN